MAHVKIELDVAPEWLLARAVAEPEDGVTSVGGLAHRLFGPGGLIARDPCRISFARLIDWSRRRLRLTNEDLARSAAVDVRVIISIVEREHVPADPDDVRRLAGVLNLAADPLLKLAGFTDGDRPQLDYAATRFAARPAEVAPLSAAEEDALNQFLQELATA